MHTHGVGVHRFDMDGRYAYISTEMEGFVGNILVVYEIADPARPNEVSRWWMPGQHVAGGETPHWRGLSNRLHHALRFGDELWAAVWYAGIRVLDARDISKLKTVGEFNYHPPFPEPTHTVAPVPVRWKGRQVAVAVDEEHDHVRGQLHGGLWFLDVEQRDAIRPIGMFHLSELDFAVQPQRAPLRRASVPGAGGGSPPLLHVVLGRPAHARHQQSDRARGDRLLHPGAGLRPQEPAEQRRLRRPSAGSSICSIATTGSTFSNRPDELDIGCHRSAGRDLAGGNDFPIDAAVGMAKTLHERVRDSQVAKAGLGIDVGGGAAHDPLDDLQSRGGPIAIFRPTRSNSCQAGQPAHIDVAAKAQRMHRRADRVLDGGHRREIDDGHHFAGDVGETVAGRMQDLRRSAQLIGAELGEEPLDGGASFRRAQIAPGRLAPVRT